MTQVFPAAVVLLILLWVPGSVLAYAGRLRGLNVLAVAPVLSFGVFAIAVRVSHAADITWRPLPALALVGVVTLLGAGAVVLLRHTWRVRSTRGREVFQGVGAGPETSSAEGGVSRSSRFAILDGRVPHLRYFIGVLVGSAVVVIVPLVIGIGSPRYPMQQWDAVFHDNAIRLINESGVADNVDALFGSGNQVYYPALWHSVMALVPLDFGILPWVGVSATTIAFFIVSATLMWPLGIAALVNVLFPNRPKLVVIATAIACGFATIPVLMYALLKALWPNGTGTLLTPGVLVLVVLAIQLGRSVWKNDRRLQSAFTHGVLHVAALAGLILVGLYGIFSIHPVSVVGVFVLCAAPLIGWAWHVLMGLWRSGRRVVVAVVSGLGIGTLVGLILVAWSIPMVQSVINYQQPVLRWYPVSVARLLFDWVITFWPANVILSAATIVGVVKIWLTGTRWVVGTWGIVIALSTIAAGWENPLRGLLTGLWYKQAMRIETLYPIVAVVLISIGLVEISGWVARRLNAWRGTMVTPRRAITWVLAAAFVLSLGFNAPARAQYFAWTYQPNQLRWGAMISADELDFLEALPEKIDSEYRIIGSPFSGLTSAYALSGVRSVYLNLAAGGEDPARAFLRLKFNAIHTDLKVCEYLNELDVRYFYQDTSATGPGGAWENRDATGFDNVDTSQGFDEVARSGNVTVYRITACKLGEK